MDFEWITIPRGPFPMGIADDEAAHLSQTYHAQTFLWEAPQRSVFLGSFEISKYPVTYRQYDAFRNATGYMKWSWFSGHTLYHVNGGVQCPNPNEPLRQNLNGMRWRRFSAAIAPWPRLNVTSA